MQQGGRVGEGCEQLRSGENEWFAEAAECLAVPRPLLRRVQQRHQTLLNEELGKGLTPPRGGR